MAIYRCVQIKFWTDSKVADDFTPEDKYFYLYLFTNPHTNLSGCYEVSLKQMSDETGYNKDTIERLLDRFKTIHHVIDYSKETKEVLLLNWHKYNWTTSKDFQKGLINQIEEVKNPDFKEYLLEIMDGRETVYGRSMDGRETSVTVINNNTVSLSNTDNTLTNSIREIIDYLNLSTNKDYKYKTKKTIDCIKARMNEGYTVNDFKKVIDIKTSCWKNDPKFDKFLRPETLFGNKFEGYLNERPIKNRSGSFLDLLEKDGDVID